MEAYAFFAAVGSTTTKVFMTLLSRGGRPIPGGNPVGRHSRRDHAAAILAGRAIRRIARILSAAEREPEGEASSHPEVLCMPVMHIKADQTTGSGIPESEASPEARLQVGDTVLIIGLTSKAGQELNGRLGTVVAAINTAGRVQVEVGGGAGKQLRLVKPCNLRLAVNPPGVAR